MDVEEGQPLQPQFKLPELLLGLKYPEMISFCVRDETLSYSIHWMIKTNLKRLLPQEK